MRLSAQAGGPENRPMKLSDLQRELRTVDPAAILVSPWVLDRVIRQEHRLPSLIWEVPHHECYVIDRATLHRHVDQEELDLESDRLLPTTVILLSRPEPEELTDTNTPALLLKYWRRLFHANLHLSLKDLTPADIRERIDHIGPVEFEEIRRVLDEDGYLMPEADDLAVYTEFAAVFLDLYYFAINQLPAYFPGLHDIQRAYRLLHRDVDAGSVFSRTRPAGVPDPTSPRPESSDESHDYYWKLVASAERAARLGNTVRSAILFTRAARVAPVVYTLSARAQAEAQMTHLVERLKAALLLSDDEAVEWLKDLQPVLDKADQGPRPSEAELLFRLQRACLDHERDIYALDLAEWLISVGKRPIKRPLPSQRLVQITKHLRGAALLLARARLTDADRQHLARQLEIAVERSEERLRERFRPILRETFLDVGLRPTNPPEMAAFHKMIEELLDRITEYGFITFGELRDTISRNQLKLPDLRDPADFTGGDPLVRLDRRLGTLLDGVYRPAEFYLRWLEWFTALFFGWFPGRVLTRFVLFPFGGAFLAVETVAMVMADLHEPPPTDYRLQASLILGLFFLCLIHLEGFRQRCVQTVVGIGRVLKTIFIDVPASILQMEPLRVFLDSGPFQLFNNYVLKPLGAYAALRLWRPGVFGGWVIGGLTFLAANFILNSRPGRAATDATVHALAKLYELLRAGLLPGLLRLTLTIFKQAQDALQYILFSVDEWLRFRSGDSRWSMGVRAVLSLLWFPVSYLTRFYLVVLIEPMVNPLKLPLSILFAKFVYPMLAVFGLFTVQTLSSPLVDHLAPWLSWPVAWFVVIGTFYLLPDACTFLFWEMRENWRVYRANRPVTLRPVPVGAHGETVRRLLQPGFHSGTLPKLYARLRRAERDAAETGSYQAVRVCQQLLQEVERALRRLVEREMIVLVRQSPQWRDETLHAGKVVLASNRLSVELAHPQYEKTPVWLDVEDRAGWLVAGLRSPGWITEVPPPQREVIALALAGLYKLADIDVVREQVEALVPQAPVAFDVTATSLVLWTDHRGGRAIQYPLARPDHTLTPRTSEGEVAPDWPVLKARRLIYSKLAIPWQQWVEAWQRDQDGEPPVPLFDVDVQLLPAGPDLPVTQNEAS
jgi:hypothetical protein